MRFAFVERNRDWYTIAALCRNLEVSKAGYYAWRERGLSLRAQSDQVLSAQIRALHSTSSKTYGSPTIHRALHQDGYCVGRKRVARLMREAGLRSKRRPLVRKTTQSDHTYAIAPNLLNRNFTLGAPNLAWVGDITYFATREGWLYLAVVLDLFSRRVVGWSMKHRIDRTLVLDALQMGLEQRNPKPGLIMHTDRGSQYACTEYRQFIERHGIRPSMSRKGDCWDNAVAESFFATLKAELACPIWETRAQARSEIFHFIEIWYNRQRRHSTIGYLSPSVFEESQSVA